MMTAERTTARKLPGGAVIDDRRSDSDKARTVGFVVATDSFMSGWGGAKGGRSFFAVPFAAEHDFRVIQENMENRSEMKRVRVVGADYRPHLRAGDHFSIRDMSDCSRFYERGGFLRRSD